MRPLHKQRWDEVAAAYNDHIAGKDFCARDADALKRRFMVLAYAKKPSGKKFESVLDVVNHDHFFLPRRVARGDGSGHYYSPEHS